MFVRSEAQLDRAQAAVEKAGMAFKVLDEHVETTSGHVSISTMHLAKGLPAHDQPRKTDLIGLRRYIYGLLYDLPRLPNGRPGLVLPEIDGGEEGEVSAFEELAEWPLEAYPLEARCILENIAVDRTEFQRWAEPQPLFSAALPVIAPDIASNSITNAEGQSEPDTQAKTSTTIGAQTKCQNWLLDKMKSGDPGMPKKDYLAIAINKFGVSERSFKYAWANAVELSENSAWSRPGRRSWSPYRYTNIS